MKRVLCLFLIYMIALGGAYVFAEQQEEIQIKCSNSVIEVEGSLGPELAFREVSLQMIGPLEQELTLEEAAEQPEANQPGSLSKTVFRQINADGSLHVVNLPGEMKDNGELAGTTVVQLSQDGQKVLSVGLEEAALQVDRNPWNTESVTYYSGYRVNVYDLDRKAQTFSGTLDTGRDMTWGLYLSSSDFIYYGLAGELMSMNRDSYTVFPQQTQEG